MSEFLECMREEENWQDEIDRINDNFDRIPNEYTGDRDLPGSPKKKIVKKKEPVNILARFEPVFEQFAEILYPGLPEQGQRPEGEK